MVAMFLDPRYKNLRMLTQQQRDEVMDYVADLIPEETVAEPPTNQDETQSIQIKQEVQDKCLFDCLLGDVEIDLTKPTAALDECKQYLSEPVRISDPLKWWSVYENKYMLAQLFTFFW